MCIADVHVVQSQELTLVKVDDEALLATLGILDCDVLHQEIALQIVVASQVVVLEGALLDLEGVVALEQCGVRTIVVQELQLLSDERFLKNEKVETSLR